MCKPFKVSKQPFKFFSFQIQSLSFWTVFVFFEIIYKFEFFSIYSSFNFFYLLDLVIVLLIAIFFLTWDNF
jgi:hypothetical protein